MGSVIIKHGTLKGSRPPRGARGLQTLTLLLSLLPPLSLRQPALAQAAAPEADEAQFRFLRGNTLYRQGRFEEALSEYYLSD